ncbi:MAG: hypothetical protein ACPGVN_08835 [Alphaproteobacteria bacterium]
MKQKNKTVLSSVNMHGEGVCVDFFVRSNGTFGFEEYRRDFEDARGWFAIGNFEHLAFNELKEAEKAALKQVSWLEDEMKSSAP